MENVGELRDEVGRLRELVDAGHRGRPIGGEVLAAFGGIVGLGTLIVGAAAFRLIPVTFMGSAPLAAAAAFLVFVIVVTGRGGSGGTLRRAVLLSLLAGLSMEVVWRGLSAWSGIAAKSWDPQFQAYAALVGLLVLLGTLTVTFIATAWLGITRLRRQFAPLSPVNRALLGVWSGVTMALFVVVIICILAGLRTGVWFAPMLLPSLFWLLWGIGWWISGWVSGSRWMRWVGLGSWLLAAGFIYAFDLYFTSAAALFVLAMLPGLQLMREARMARVEG